MHQVQRLLRRGLPFEVLHGRADELDTEHDQNKKHTHDFARAPLRQPALEPGEDHLQEQQVERGEQQHHGQRPDQQQGTCRGNAEQHSSQPQTAQRGCRIASVCSGSLLLAEAELLPVRPLLFALAGVVAVYTAEDLGDYWQPGPLLVPPLRLSGLSLTAPIGCEAAFARPRCLWSTAGTQFSGRPMK